MSKKPKSSYFPWSEEQLTQALIDRGLIPLDTKPHFINQYFVRGLGQPWTVKNATLMDDAVTRAAMEIQKSAPPATE